VPSHLFFVGLGLFTIASCQGLPWRTPVEPALPDTLRSVPGRLTIWSRGGKRGTGEGIESRFLVHAQLHLPHDLAVHVRGEADVAVASMVLDERRMGASLRMQGDEGPPHVVLPNTAESQRFQRAGEKPAPDVLRVNWVRALVFDAVNLHCDSRGE